MRHSKFRDWLRLVSYTLLSGVVIGFAGFFVLRSENEDSAKVRMPPPATLVNCLTVSFIVHYLHPVTAVKSNLHWLLGAILLVVGAGIAAYCLTAFKRAQTSIEPWRPTSAIVKHGLLGR
jgi:protein-S-isoprenylcysteine O-methyltransferase Ste14